MKIVCLHTADSNAVLFDEAAATLGISLSHTVRADLYQAAIAQGGADEVILSQTSDALRALEGDAVILTCSTLGPAAARAGALRTDDALAERAVRDGDDVEVFVTTPTTIEPTRSLFEQHAARTGARINMHMIEGALDAFLAGDLDRYADLIANAADQAGEGVIALAQASMAPAAAKMKRSALTSPREGLMKAVEIVKTSRLS